MKWLSDLLRPRADSAGHARLRARLFLFGALVIVAFAASSGYDAWRAYRNAIASTNRELGNLANALAEQTAWGWQGADRIVAATAQWQLDNPDQPAKEVDQRLAMAAASVPQVRSLHVMNAQGHIRYSSDAARTWVNLARRPFFLAQENGTAHGLFVSEPLLTLRDRRVSVFLSRSIVDRRGRFAGVVVAIVDLSDLTRLYGAVHLRGNLSVLLFREDGTLLVRSPAAQALVGRRFTALSALRPGQVTRVRSPIDGEREFMAVAPVSGLPLVVAVTRGTAAALDPIYRETLDTCARTLLLTLLAVLTIFAMARQLRHIEQVGLALQQSQKMEAIGTLTGGIAHDFNNILAAILGYGELAQSQAPEDRALRRYLDNIMQAAGRARALVDRILGFSRSGIAEQVPIDVQRVVAETLELLQPSLAPNVRLVRALNAPDSAIVGDETRLHQVVMNLCTNALQAMPGGGVLRVALEQTRLDAALSLRRRPLAPGRYVRLTLSDTGTGIRPEDMDRIFDPFFTTKPVGEGTGLGLSVVHGIIADFGGAIEVSGALGKGTTFRVWLPVSSATVAAVEIQAPEPARGRGEIVMVVDDEPALVSLTEEMLAELGYEPVGFRSSTAALAAFRSDPKRFDIVLTDELMPELRGTELAAEVRSLRPDIPIMLVSGRGDRDLAACAKLAGVSEVLHKPLRKGELADAVASCLHRAPTQAAAAPE